ncbi:MAG: hypothetical protein J2P15_17965 [Micromonosporaceae bacterium]|nr:hypothetical protein [Micromonosporaceae bacterium]
MAAYLPAEARKLLDEAQQQINRHAAVGPDGRCPTCRGEAPCQPRLAASAVFARYGRLPRRQTGLASSGPAPPGGA